MTDSADPGLGARELVARLGGHPLTTLHIDPCAGEVAWGRWLVAAVVWSTRAGAEQRLEACRSLARAGLADPGALAGADPAAVARAIAAARIRNPEALAARLVRASRRLAEDHGGSLGALARGASDLEELGLRLGALAPGIGIATVARFLRPLREVWPPAREIPLAPTAHAAARHLGWLAEGEEGEPTALRAALAAQPAPPPWHDVEAALERLGAAACARERPDRCPLGADCPLGAGRRGEPREGRGRASR